MKRILLLITLVLLISFNSWAKHEKGGWVQYEYVGAGASANTSIYKITITVFYSCLVTGPRGVDVGIYDGATNGIISKQTFQSESSEESINKTTYSSCLSPKPTPLSGNTCYLVDKYVETITLNNNGNGYLIGVNTSGHRVDNLINIANSGNTSLAMWAKIPGLINGVDYHINSSPVFLFKDTVIICYRDSFNYQFNAVDSVDHDSLSYSFGNGQNGASVSTPPYPSVTYSYPYSAKSPLGSKVVINEATGLISGIAPSTIGEYIFDVYVKEWRKGVLIDSIKKELQIDVNDCSLLSAELQKVYVNCDSLTLSFQNLSTASNIDNYIWNFGDNLSSSNSSNASIGSHTFSNAGDYTLTLFVSNIEGCNNTTTAIVKVYPGFTPKFKTIGSCYQSAIQFEDATIAKYGVINNWLWDFGDPTSANNSATSSTTSHLYDMAETVPVILHVGSSVGCSGSDTVQVIVNDKPNINIPFSDTLICSNDTLPLIAQIDANAVNYSWSPTYHMINPTSLNPKVYPQDTTTYTLTVHQNGCVGSASIKVNVLHFITVSFHPDTMHVCLTDSLKLSPISYALSYKWTESNQNNTLGSDTAKYPKALPKGAFTTYYVKANLGHCPANDSIKVYASPYPKAKIINPASDTTICFGDSIKLKATKLGGKALWLPINGLESDTTLSQIAKPTISTSYKLSVTDTFYCPKTVTDSVSVNVIPSFSVTAGDDTTAVVSEPLQLYALISDTTFKYPVSYKWSPTTFFNNPEIQNPVITVTTAFFDTIRVTAITTNQHCVGKGKVFIKFFSTKPDIFVPSAFLPNGITQNRVLMPIPVGIAHFDYFRVFNRLGQLIYSTNNLNEGWDGTVGGVIQNSGTYVYVTQGIDYQKNVVTRKGTVVLIR